MNKIGDIHNTTKQDMRRMRQILTFDEYEQIAKRMIHTAIHAEKDRDAIAAAIYIMDRIEGKIPVEQNVTFTDRKTVADALKELPADTQVDKLDVTTYGDTEEQYIDGE